MRTTLAVLAVVAATLASAIAATIVPRGPAPDCPWWCYLNGNITIGFISSHLDDNPGCSEYPGTECEGYQFGLLDLSPVIKFEGLYAVSVLVVV